MRIFNYKKKNDNINHLLTSESVSEGHPDKICDQISDAILDEYLSHDTSSKVAIESMVVPNKVIVAGEVTSTYKPSAKRIEQIIRNLIKNIGYKTTPFAYDEISIENLIHKQSPEILHGVKVLHGAGDQGIMFGYACDETDEFMPAPIHYANKIMEVVMSETKAGRLTGLGPDAKCQVTLEYDKHQKPCRARTIILSIQHDKKLTAATIKKMTYGIVAKCLPEGWMCSESSFLVNTAGKFTIGGPQSDTGLTGRKIIVDTYGGAAPHGGGAFSGKDPTKVDRSGAYIARYIAKNIVATCYAKKCLIQLAYAIGVAEPVSLFIDCFGTAKIKEEKLLELIHRSVDLTPNGIIKHLELDKPIYLKTSTYGHFGRAPTNDGCFTWERLDMLK